MIWKQVIRTMRNGFRVWVALLYFVSDGLIPQAIPAKEKASESYITRQATQFIFWISASEKNAGRYL